jgi:probable HAF family extracellular repeat protein
MNDAGSHGFLYNPNGATWTTLDDPLATNGTIAYGINDAGQIVGTYNTSTGTHSFIYSGGIYTTIDDPVNGHTFARVRGDARGRDGGICQELAAGVRAMSAFGGIPGMHR